MKCSKRMCPMQHNTISDDCDIKDCQYRTEDIDATEVIGALCNRIADLVVQKLKSESKEKQAEDEAKAFQLGLAFGFGEKYDEMDKIIDEIKKKI